MYEGYQIDCLYAATHGRQAGKRRIRCASSLEGNVPLNTLAFHMLIPHHCKTEWRLHPDLHPIPCTAVIRIRSLCRRIASSSSYAPLTSRTIARSPHQACCTAGVLSQRKASLGVIRFSSKRWTQSMPVSFAKTATMYPPTIANARIPKGLSHHSFSVDGGIAS